MNIITPLHFPLCMNPKKRPKEIRTLLRTHSEDSGTPGLLQLPVRNEWMNLIPHRNNILNRLRRRKYLMSSTTLYRLSGIALLTGAVLSAIGYFLSVFVPGNDLQ